MQVNCCTGEVYAASKAKAAGEEIELQTITMMPNQLYMVVCWHTAEDEVRWTREFGLLSEAVDEYNKWALNPERVPSFN